MHERRWDVGGGTTWKSIMTSPGSQNDLKTRWIKSSAGREICRKGPHASHLPDVRPWLASSSAFVLPSYYREGVPRSTQEAMAMARPVITTDAPGCRETVIDGVNGFLVPPRDASALADAMERFVLEPELIERMGAASRRIAEERFDVRRINRRMMEAMGLG